MQAIETEVKNLKPTPQEIEELHEKVWELVQGIFKMQVNKNPLNINDGFVNSLIITTK